MTNPLMIIYSGGYSLKSGAPYLVPRTGGQGSISWLPVHDRLKTCSLDLFLVLDIKYLDDTGRREGFALPQQEGAGTAPRRLEAIFTSADAAESEQSMISAVVNSMLELSNKRAFDILQLAADLRSGPEAPQVEYLNKSTEHDDSSIEIHSITVRDGNALTSYTKSRPHSFSGRGVGATSTPKRPPAQPLSVLWRSQPKPYGRVKVLPIAWNDTKDVWEPKKELEQLIQVFKSSFFGNVEAIFEIPVGRNARSALKAKITACLRELGRGDLFVVLYNSHAAPDVSRNMTLLRTGHFHQGTVNWTEVVHELNKSPCDVLQILDCCHAATATKGDKIQETTQLIGASNETTQAVEFEGRNETLASCGRDVDTHAGTWSSMPLFARVLADFVPENKLHPPFIQVDHWYHAIDSEVYKAMRVGAKEDVADFWRTPYRKMNPIHYCQDSIPLWTRSGIQELTNGQRQ
ncbi:hypothetical protein VPNG_03825 [Cytospora leucostoma]|uniref:Uncharacterized protein n=1 Tax=Cytospora leucostoma TaxID=1230097 RepID=A0A423XFA2_9PEZI|nr:hypothetical protein VPNG_03825 [Cytospora leucostoma]